jgi:hypothetical protein
MTRPDFDRAIEGLHLIAKGAALLDANAGALPKPAQDLFWNDQCVLANVDAAGVDRLRLAIEAMREVTS